MNNIKIVNGQIVISDINDNIDISFCEEINLLSVKKLKLDILNDTNLQIIFEGEEEIKFNILINVLENVKANIYILKKDLSGKIKYEYNLSDNSSLYINKFYDINTIKEVDIVNLNGVLSNIDYDLHTISKNKEYYDLIVNHNNKLSKSNINNKAVNILDGKLTFNVTGVVLNNIIDCTINQNNHIITMNDNKCQINPNLLINENDVTANHSAYIGGFDPQKLFYLKSRGITENEAYKLLIRGFLLNQNQTEENFKLINDIIDKYWR